MGTKKTKNNWSQYSPERIALFLVEAATGNFDSDWKDHCQAFANLVSARTFSHPLSKEHINDVKSLLKDGDANHNQKALSQLFTELDVGTKQPKFLFRDLKTFVEELILALDAEEIAKRNYARHRKAGKGIKAETPLPFAEDVPSQQSYLAKKNPKKQLPANLSQIAQYLYSITNGKDCRFANDATRELSSLLNRRFLQVGAPSEVPDLKDLTADKDRNRKVLVKLFRLLEIDNELKVYTIDSFLDLLTKLEGELLSKPKRKQRNSRTKNDRPINWK